MSEALTKERMTSEEVHDWWVKARRKVGKQRARKLRRRGEFVWWSEELRSRVWIPNWSRV